MGAPELSVRNSGYGGRGYKAIFEPGQPTYPSVTTTLGVLEKGGIVQWAVDNTSAYAVANLDQLMNKSELQGYNFLRWYNKRVPDFDDPSVDIHNYHVGVLNDAAELGTLVHEWIEADLNGWEEPEIVRSEQEEMIEQYLLWRSDHDVEVYVTEATVFGDGYAGTADAFWKVDGVKYCHDHKTSRGVRDEHFAQLGALGAAHTMAVPTEEFDDEAVEYKGKFWRPEPLPAFEKYSILHLRPTTQDGPAFCELKVIDQTIIDAAFELFKGALSARLGQYQLKMAKKAVEEGGLK